ncbi:MAG: hypothetical protein AB8C95_08915, partial [Phycisphaeraceae bacterium]
MPGNPTSHAAKRILLAMACLCVLLMGQAAQAQQAGVQIDIQRDFLGLGGIVQRGTWTPVR